MASSPDSTPMDTSQRQDSPTSLVDSAVGGMGSPDIQIKSQCSSLSDEREENFESYGENDDVEYEA